MKKFATKYRTGGKTYCSHIFARNRRQADLLAKSRGIGETVEGEVLDSKNGFGKKLLLNELHPKFDKLSDANFIKKLPDIIHSAVFLSYIAIQSGRMKHGDFFGDEGPVHQLVHLMTMPEIGATDIKRARKAFALLQKLIPGHYPS